MEELIILAVLGIVKGAVKNPAKAATLKKYMLEVRDTINELFPGE